ncbi:type VI secretion system Vgr family protein, partial [Roseateles sp. GG27B]
MNGVVTRFEQGGTTGRFDTYRIELRPWLWQLTLGADCRIFQDKTVVDILKAVFAEYKPAGTVENKLTGNFRMRPYTVQYRESDFNFVSRLMEEEGIYYYFKHAQNQHTLVLCNSATGHAMLEGNDLHWAHTITGSQLREDVITQWSCAHSLGSLKYTHTDFAAEEPSANLTGTAERASKYPAPNELEVFDYPGAYDDLAMTEGKIGEKQTEADRLAKMQVDSFESGHVQATGISIYRHLAAGFTFNFADHADKGGYLISRVDYEMEFAGYEANQDVSSKGFTCRFEAVPKSIRYMPRPSVARPTIHGP